MPSFSYFCVDCQDFHRDIQGSTFDCAFQHVDGNADPEAWEKFRSQLSQLLEPVEIPDWAGNQPRIYFSCKKCEIVAVSGHRLYISNYG